MKVRKAVFPAAGLGTRFLPATKAQPEEMLPLVDKPIIQYVVEEVVASGLEEIILVTGRRANRPTSRKHRGRSLDQGRRRGADAAVNSRTHCLILVDRFRVAHAPDGRARPCSAAPRRDCCAALPP